MDLNSPESLTLLEDGLILWYETVRNAPKMIQDFVRLAPRILEIVSRSLENFQVFLTIVADAIGDFMRRFIQITSSLVVGRHDSGDLGFD